MDNNIIKLIKINIERHPNSKMRISKIKGTILYFKCSSCNRAMSAKCSCSCSFQQNCISTNNNCNLPSSLHFEKVNNLTNHEGLILHKNNLVHCLELARMLVLEKVYTVSKQYSLIWFARSFGGFYESGTDRCYSSSYVVYLKRYGDTSDIGINRWNIRDDENENNNNEQQQQQQE